MFKIFFLSLIVIIDPQQVIIRYNELKHFGLETKNVATFGKINKSNDLARTRTWNLLIRSQTPYPFGHESC